MNSPAPQPKSERTPQQPFQAVMITLSAALLVLFGIVIGRFVVTTQAVEVVDHFGAELSMLRAELVDLNRQVVTADAQAELARQSAERYRQLATQERIRADKLVARQLVLNQTMSHVVHDRQMWLQELQQHVALNRSIPANDVLQFAEAMFEVYAGTLQQLASDTDSSARPMPTLPRLHLGAETLADHEPTPAVTQRFVRQPVVTQDASQTSPRLPAPTTSRQSRGVFFAPPPRRQPSQYTYFPAQRSRRMATLPRSSGITFLDTADADDGETVRR